MIAKSILIANAAALITGTMVTNASAFQGLALSKNDLRHAQESLAIPVHGCHAKCQDHSQLGRHKHRKNCLTIICIKRNRSEGYYRPSKIFDDNICLNDLDGSFVQCSNLPFLPPVRH